MASRPTRDPNGMTPRGTGVPGGHVERAAPQDRDLGLAGVRLHRPADRQRGRDQEHSSTTEGSVGESGRADQTIADAAPEHAQEMVLIQSSERHRRRPRVPCGGRRRAAEARGAPRHPELREPLRPGEREPDLHRRALGAAALSDRRQGQRVIGQGEAGGAAVDATQAAHPGFTLGEFGDASTKQQIDKVVQDDFGKALKTSLPMTLIILLFAFGALVAAAIPLLLALTAVMAHDRHHGPGQPPDRRSRQLDQRGDPPDRSRRRRRLLDVLPAPRARGARGRAQRGCGAGRRGGDLGACGDGLRLHGDDRDGRDVLRRGHRRSSRSPRGRSWSSPWRWSAR